MPPWITKAALQGLLSILPKSQSWNYQFQKYVTRSMPLGRNMAIFATKIEQAQRHLDNFQSIVGSGQPPNRVVELGTGWFPIVPIAFALSGVNQIITYDIVSLLHRDNVQQTLQLFVKYDDQGDLKRMLPGVQQDRLDKIKELAQDTTHNPVDLLNEAGITCLIHDAARSGLPNASVELLVSNTTLEHIPGDAILAIFREFRRIAAPSSVMSHLIDISDHYSHFDHRITAYNYLRYSESSWRIFNNSLQYQNRLRLSDYLKLHTDAGFAVKHQDNFMGASEELSSVPLAQPFQDYTQEDLLVLRSWLVSVPDHVKESAA
jgi:hypothetical protein